MRQAQYGTWQGLQRRLLWAYDGEPPGGLSGYRGFEDSGGWLVRSGEARIDVGKQGYLARPGEWLLPPPTGVERQRFATGTRILSVRFKLHWPDGRPLFHPGRALVVSESKFPNLRTAAEELAARIQVLQPDMSNRLPAARTSLTEFASIEQSFAGMVEAWCQAMDALGVEKRVPGDLDPRIAHALDLIDRTDRPMKQIASLVSLSVSQLDRLFLRELGQSPHAYRNARRLERIRSALRSSDEPIKAIAYREGFRRLSHFSAWFASQMNMSPREYRTRAMEVEA